MAQPVDEFGTPIEPYSVQDAKRLLVWLNMRLKGGRTISKDDGDHRAIQRALAAIQADHGQPAGVA